MKYLLLSILFFVFSATMAQNEVYVKGNDGTNPTLYIKGSDGTNPTLFVKGEIVNDNGIFQNEDGDIELSGNWTNTVSGTAKFESTGEEKFSNTADITISGTMDGTTSGTLNGSASGINQFYNLKVNSNSTTVEINLASNINVHSSGSLEFLTDGKITTSTNNVFVRNSATSSISGYTFPATNTTAGANTRYINGNLKRTLTTATYDYPVGDANVMIPFKITNTTGSGDVLGNVETGAFLPGNSGYFYCDIATHPGTGGSGQTLAAASSNAPDGIIDQLQFNVNSTKQWNANLTSGSITDYDIEVFPGDFDVSGVYTSTTGDLRYLLKNGVMFNDGTGVLLSNNSYNSLGFTETGYDDACPPSSAYKINNLTSFSTFRLGGVTPSGGTLPVELIYLDAFAVDNEFIQIAWQTATEINNKGFEVQKSENGVNFENIGFVEGAKNSNETNSYLFNDKKVLANKVYYYRLNQVDFDGASKLTENVSASLKGNDLVNVSPFIPNPAQNATQLEIQVSQRTVAQIIIYNGVGQMVLNERINLQEGLNVVPFNIDGLASGIYQSTIKLNDKSFSRKLHLIK